MEGNDMTEEIPRMEGREVHGADFVNVAFAPGGVYEAFKSWVESNGLALTPPMVFGEDENEIPTQFVVLTDETAAAIWPDGPVAQVKMSKLGQPDE
jgi:hypothetical protein